jgi:uncharacterized protein YjbI with pentapeptide repeats
MSTITLKDCRHTIDASDANLSESRFEDSRMAQVVFRDLTLEGSSFSNVMLDDCRFEQVSFAGVRIADCRYDGMTIDGIPVLDLLAAHRRMVAA